AGPLVLQRVVPGDETLERGLALRVGDLLGLHLGGRGGGGEDGRGDQGAGDGRVHGPALLPRRERCQARYTAGEDCVQWRIPLLRRMSSRGWPRIMRSR